MQITRVMKTKKWFDHLGHHVVQFRQIFRFILSTKRVHETMADYFIETRHLCLGLHIHKLSKPQTIKKYIISILRLNCSKFAFAFIKQTHTSAFPFMLKRNPPQRQLISVSQQF